MIQFWPHLQILLFKKTTFFQQELSINFSFLIDNINTFSLIVARNMSIQKCVFSIISFTTSHNKKNSVKISHFFFIQEFVISNIQQICAQFYQLICSRRTGKCMLIRIYSYICQLLIVQFQKIHCK